MLLPTQKSTILRIINQQENLIAIFLSEFNVDEHVSTKINTFKIYMGVWGPAPQTPNIFFLKKIKQNGGFSLCFFFAFWQGSLDPQNYKPSP